VGQLSVQKVIWVFGTETESVLVMGIVPKGRTKKYLRPVEKAVLSSIWKPMLVVDPGEALGFRLGDTGGMKLFSRSTNMLIYTADGRPDSEHTGKPVFVIGPAYSPVSIEDQEDFADRRLRQFTAFEVVRVESKERIRINELDGYAMIARTRSDGQPGVAYSVILYEEQGYWVALGTASEAKRATALPMFRRIAESFRRTKNGPVEAAPDR
jgi:hypothetical protein